MENETHKSHLSGLFFLAGLLLMLGYGLGNWQFWVCLWIYCMVYG